MASKQISISRSKIMSQVLAEAYNTFPDAETDGQALTMALCDWLYTHQKDSKSASLKRIEAIVNEILDLLRRNDVDPT